MVFEHPGQGLLEIVGKDQDFVGCLLSESPRQSDGAVERGLAALLDAAVKDRVVGQAAILIEVKGEPQHFALMIAKPEGLAQLVFLDQLVYESYRRNGVHAFT
jgi:hypothetical protein